MKRTTKRTVQFDILTLFPQLFEAYGGESILKRAGRRKLIQIRTHNIRNFAAGRQAQVDDRPYGGGAGMVLKAEPILKAVRFILGPKPGRRRRKIIILSAKGKLFNQSLAAEWSRKINQFILISGRYEGIDERVKRALLAEEISIGEYVLTDGDLAAMVVISAVARLLPGVIRFESLAEESHFQGTLNQEGQGWQAGGLEYPHYTRPEVISYQGKRYRVPSVLLSGNHQAIKRWRQAR